MRVGTTELDDSPVVTHKVVAMDVHPAYNKTAEFDVSRLKLEEPLVFSETVQPIGMPRRTTFPDESTWESATIAGKKSAIFIYIFF